jgi:two-component system response regulator HydG
MCATLCDGLQPRGFDVTTKTVADEALEAVASAEFDVVVTDLRMQGMTGLDLCSRINEERPDIPVVVITAFGSMDAAVGAIRSGAYDFITKPVEIEHLAVTLSRAIEHRALREEVKRLRQAVAQTQLFEGIIGESPVMRKLNDLINRAAAADASVLITGESGTGKELVARALHARSRRHEKPFVALSCAAMPETLLESELFGHVKGAFTDARADRKGLFAQADGGTIFLDEIGTMPLTVQPKLLRALQERHARPVGGNKEVPFDVRLVTATNEDLETAVHDGRFRSDLFYRLNVIHLHVPPLRARGKDILMLAQHFLEQYAVRSAKEVTGLSSHAAQKLLAYNWPGNVRELQNCLECAVALTAYDRLTVEDLPERIQEYRSSHVVVASEDPTELVPMEEVERRYILRVLDAVRGNKTLAAQILGFDRRTLYRKLETYLPEASDDAHRRDCPSGPSDVTP